MSKLDLRDPETWIPRELFAAYCGDGSASLLAYYDRAKAKCKPMLWSFDWFAFLLLPAWFGYRRQWALYATLNVSIALIALTTTVIHVDLPVGAFAGSLLALGLMARGLLLTTAIGRYAKLKRRGLADDAIRDELEDKARASPGLALAALLGALAIQGSVVALLGA